MIRRPPRSTQSRSSAASDVYKRQVERRYRTTKERNMVAKYWLRIVMFVCGLLLVVSAQANFPSVPSETYDALKLDRSSTTPKQLHEALVKRYKDPAQGAGSGSMAEYWEPIPYTKYLDPATFYTPPTSMREVASRGECVECHTDESPVWVQALSLIHISEPTRRTPI